MGYNFYNNNTTNVIPNVGGATSRISMGYGTVSIYTGGINAEPTNLGYYQDSTGKVGIGTTNPGYKLETSGGAIAVTGTNNYLYYAVTNSTASGAYMMFDAQTAGGSGRKYQIGTTGTGNNPGTGCFELYDATGNATRLVVNASGNVGIGTTNPTVQLDLSTDGARKLTTSTWTTGSDERIKTDIQSANLQTCYDTIKSIDLKYFKWNFPAESNVTVDDNHSLGFIAQDVKKVFPNAVSETNSYGFTDFLSLNTDQILKAMYGALRQTMADKESLEQRLAALESKLAA